MEDSLWLCVLVEHKREIVLKIIHVGQSNILLGYVYYARQL